MTIIIIGIGPRSRGRRRRNPADDADAADPGARRTYVPSRLWILAVVARLKEAGRPDAALAIATLMRGSNKTP